MLRETKTKVYFLGLNENDYALSARLSSLVWALKPVLIADTDRVEPHDSHCTK